MLKGVDKLNNFLTDWVKSNGIDTNCKLSADFGYDKDDDTIYYALALPEHDIELFDSICKPLLNEELSPFILSLFHEIGHKYTINNFSKQDLDNYYKANKKYNNFEANLYHYSDIEYEATKWGCNYINNNFDKVNKLYNDFISLVIDFYKVNEIEVN